MNSNSYICLKCVQVDFNPSSFFLLGGFWRHCCDDTSQCTPHDWSFWHGGVYFRGPLLSTSCCCSARQRGWQIWGGTGGCQPIGLEGQCDPNQTNQSGKPCFPIHLFTVGSKSFGLRVLARNESDHFKMMSFWICANVIKISTRFCHAVLRYGGSESIKPKNVLQRLSLFGTFQLHFLWRVVAASGWCETPLWNLGAFVWITIRSDIWFVACVTVVSWLTRGSYQVISHMIWWAWVCLEKVQLLVNQQAFPQWTVLSKHAWICIDHCIWIHHVWKSLWTNQNFLALASCSQ